MSWADAVELAKEMMEERKVEGVAVSIRGDGAWFEHKAGEVGIPQFAAP